MQKALKHLLIMHSKAFLRWDDPDKNRDDPPASSGMLYRTSLLMFFL